MSKSEFDGLEGLEAWSAKLAEILEAAEDTAGEENFNSKTLRGRLHDFIMASPNTDEIVKLDSIAKAARKGLILTTIQGRLNNISNRTSELAMVTKKFEGISKEAEASAKKIRLERAHAVVDALTASVKAINEFKTNLETGADDKLLSRATAVITSLQGIRDEFEKIGG